MTSKEPAPEPEQARRRAQVGSPIGLIALEAVGDALSAIRLLGERSVAAPARPDCALLAEAASQIAAYFTGELTSFSLPLVPVGTPFQRMVWGFISDIPHGATWRYGDIAGVIGSGPRAVARACGANPLPIVIPCHRVVGAGRTLGGYSAPGGADTKRLLLDLESGQRHLFAAPPLENVS